MHHKRKLFMLLLIFLALSACRTLDSVEQVYRSQDPYRGHPYIDSLERWTRKARIYVGGFDLELIAAATFKTAAFREAYTTEYARTFRLSRTETEKMMKDQRDAARSHNDFVVSAFVPEKRWNDFNKTDTIWKLYLTTDGVNRIRPLEVRRIKAVDATVTHFFPYISAWDMVYLVRFPAALPGMSPPLSGSGSTRLKLVFTSVRGSAEMDWSAAGDGISGAGTN